MRRLHHRWVILPVAAVLALAALGIIGALHHNGGSSGSTPSGAVMAPQPRALNGAIAGPATGDFGRAALGSGSASSALSKSSLSAGSSLLADYVTGRGRYLIRDGYLTVVVKRGQLDLALANMTSLTASYGGYVVSSFVGTADGGGVVPLAAGGTQSSSGIAQQSPPGNSAQPMIIAPGSPYATITVRIPAPKFDLAVARFSALGEVKQLSSSSTDVTGQYVDLTARLHHYQAVEKALLTFLAKATTIGQTLAVQDRIDSTQLTIEELSAQLKQMSETIDYSTLTVTLSEKQPVAAAVVSSGTFGGALRHSLRLIADGAQVTFVAFGAALPFAAVLAGVVLVAWMLIKRFGGRRRQVPPAAPPALEA
jgi:hypothetical protein